MTKQEYWNLKERIGSRDSVGRWYNDLTHLLHLYPILRDLTVEEARMYFSDRVLELEEEIKKTLNVDD